VFVAEHICKILSYDESTLKTDDCAGYCACCERPVSPTEENLVDEFWREITDHPDPDIYIDLIIDCVNLSPINSIVIMNHSFV